MARIRERNLDDAIVLSIVEVIDGWSGRLSWDLLIAELDRRNGLRCTRQTLHRHERIRIAFNAYKKSARKPVPSPGKVNPEINLLQDYVTRLEGEIRRLKAENGALLEQFVRWAYNAHTRGLSKEFLGADLPSVDRRRSKQKGG